jgi:hypothetical protein
VGRIALAGALAGLAAAWRLDFGVFGGAAVLAAIAAGPATPRPRLRLSAVAVGSGMAVGLLAYLPLAIAAGPSTLLDSLVEAGVRGRQGLPFPLAFDGEVRLDSARSLAEDAKDLLGFYVPLLSVLGLALACAAIALALRRREAVSPTVVGLLVLTGGALVYLLSRPDEFHAQPLAVLMAALLPVACSLMTRARITVAPVALAAVFALLLAAGLANRLSALLLPPSLEPVGVAVADGVRASPSEARAIERTVRSVQALVPPGRPIYVATRRADLIRITNPMFYVLAQRPNAHRRDYGPITDYDGQREIIRDLRRTRPRALVRWTAAESVIREPNPSGRPTGVRILDRYLASSYRVRERHGDYEVLIPRAGR